MSLALFNYFTFRCEPPCPADQNVPILPLEIFSIITQSLDRTDVGLRTVVSWGLVCKFFLAECIRSCSNFRTYCFFRQINTYNIAQQTENASQIVYKWSQCKRAESDGTAFLNPIHAYDCTFNVVNLRNPTQINYYNNIQFTISEDLSIEDNLRTRKVSQHISDCFKVADKILIITWSGIFFYIQSPNGDLHFERYVEARGVVGLLNESLYLTNDAGFFKMNLDETAFSSCSADKQLSTLQGRRFITTHDRLFVFVEKSTLLKEVAFDEEKGLKVVGECILPAPIRAWPNYSIYKNWLAFPSGEEDIFLYLVNVHTQEVLIGQDRKFFFPRKETETLIMRDDFLYLQYKNGKTFWMHLPTKQDITDSAAPFFTPLLEEKNRWLIDFAILFDPKDKAPKVRLLLGEDALNDYQQHKTWVVETKLETAQGKDIQPIHIPLSSTQKTYYVAAALFLIIGLGGAALFQALLFNPSIQITRDLFISLPAIAALTLGFAGPIVILAFKRYLAENHTF